MNSRSILAQRIRWRSEIGQLDAWRHDFPDRLVREPQSSAGQNFGTLSTREAERNANTVRFSFLAARLHPHLALVLFMYVGIPL